MPAPDPTALTPHLFCPSLETLQTLAPWGQLVQEGKATPAGPLHPQAHPAAGPLVAGSLPASQPATPSCHVLVLLEAQGRPSSSLLALSECIVWFLLR